MKKVYELEYYGEKYHIVLEKTQYRSNGTLAVIAYSATPKGKIKDYFTGITVNIDDSNVLANSEDTAFADTNNLGKELYSWLKKNKIIKETGFYGFSGFCTYPLVRFTKSALEGMVEQ